MIDKLTTVLKENNLDRMYSKEILYDMCIIQFNALMKKCIGNAKITENKNRNVKQPDATYLWIKSGISYYQKHMYYVKLK